MTFILKRMLNKSRRMLFKTFRNKGQIAKMLEIPETKMVAMIISDILNQDFTDDEILDFKKLYQMRKRMKEHQNEKIRNSVPGSIGEIWGKLLYKMVKLGNGGNCLELGTNIGISGSYILAGLEKNLNTAESGSLISMDGNKERIEMAQKNFEKMDFGKVELILGRFENTFPKLLERNLKYDFVFIDGHHQKDPTINYFKKILQHLNDKSIVLFDDIYWSKGMKKAWNTVSNNKNVIASIDMLKWGICVIDFSEKKVTRHYKVVLV